MSFGGGLGSAEGRLTLDISDFISKADQAEARVRGLTPVGGQAMGGLTQAQGRMDALATGADRFGKKYRDLGIAAAGVGGVVALGFGLAINSAANFEQSMDGLGASLGGVDVAGGITKETFSALSDEALRIGQDTQFSAGEAVLAMDELAKAGQTADQILAGSARSSAELASAIGVGIPDAAAAVSSAMNMFQRDNLSAADAADIFTAAVNGSATDLPDLSAGLRNLGPIAANLGIPFNETAAAVAYFTNFGLKGADAGVSLARSLENLADPTSDATAELTRLGIEPFQNGEFIGFPALMDQLNTSMAGMSDEAKLATLSLLFGAEAADVMGISVLEGGDALRQLEKDTIPAGQAAEQAAQRMDNFKGAMETLAGSISSLMILLGTPLLGPLKAVAEFMSSLVDRVAKLPQPILNALAAVVGITGAFAALAGAIILIGPGVAKVGAQMVSMASNMMRAFQIITTGMRALTLAFATNPIGLAILAIIAILALLYLAYRRNFLGFGDAVRGVANYVKGLYKTFQDLRKTMNPVSALLRTLQRALAGIGGENTPEWIAAIARGLGELAGFIDTVVARFNFFRNTMNPVSALLAAFGTALQQASDRFGPLGDAVDRVGTAIQGLGEAFTNFIDAIQALLAGDFSGFFSEMGDAIQDVGESFLDFQIAGLEALQGLWDILSGLDWGGILSGLSDAFLSALQGISDAILEWIGNVDWGSLADRGRDLLDSLYQGITGFWEDTLQPWISTIGNLILENVPELGSSLLNKGIDLMQGLLGAIRDTGWPLVSSWLGTLGSLIVEHVPDLAGLLLNKGIALMLGFLEAIRDTGWPLVSGWLGTLGSLIVENVPDLAGLLLNKGLALIMGFLEAIRDEGWPFVSSWLGTIGDLIIENVPDLAAALLDKGIDLMQGFLGAIRDTGWPLVVGFLGTIPALAASAVGALGTALLFKGISLIMGFLDGIRDTWDSVSSYLGDLANKALLAVPNLIDTLLDKGEQLIDGFLDGIQASWETAKTWLAENISSSTITGFLDFSTNPLQPLVDFFESAYETISGIVEDILGLIKSVKDALSGGDWMTAGDLEHPEGTGGVGGSGGTSPGKKRTGVDKAGAVGSITVPVPDFSPLINAANAARQAVVAAMTNMQIESAAAVANAVTSINASFTPVSQSLTNTANMARQGVTAAFVNLQIQSAASVAAAVTSINASFTPVAQSMTNTANMARQGVHSAFVNLQISASSTISQMVSNVRNQFQQMASNAQSQASQMATQVRSQLTSMQSQAASAMAAFSASVRNGFQQAVAAAQSGVAQIRAAVNSIGNLSAQGNSIGSSLGSGIAAGISSWAGRIAAAAAAVVNAGIAAARNAAASASPSKKMRKEGRNLGWGMELGIEDKQRDVIRAFRRLIPETTSRNPYLNMPTQGLSGQQVTNITIWSLKAEEYARMLEDSQVGAGFARTYTAERGLRA